MPSSWGWPIATTQNFFRSICFQSGLSGFPAVHLSRLMGLRLKWLWLQLLWRLTVNLYRCHKILFHSSKHSIMNCCTLLIASIHILLALEENGNNFFVVYNVLDKKTQKVIHTIIDKTLIPYLWSMNLKSVSDLALSGWFFILNKYRSADFLNKQMLNNIDSINYKGGGGFAEKIGRKTQWSKKW